MSILEETLLKLREESDKDYKRYWYLNDSLDYDGTALWLTRRGSYFKGHYSQAKTMTASEAEAALNILNKRLPREATMMDYLPEW